MSIKKIYLDMDGVLSDFTGKYKEVFGSDPALVRHNKARCDKWKAFVEGEHFKKLNWEPGGQKLLAYLRNKNVQVEILSSSGGERFHENVKAQKIYWLKHHNINYHPNIVAGRRFKKDFADSESLLIDDTADNIDQFVSAGGHGIYHTNIDKTLQKLDAFLNSHI